MMGWSAVSLRYPTPALAPRSDCWLSSPVKRSPFSDGFQRKYMMNGITDHLVEEYLEGVLPARDPVLAEMELEAEKRSIPI
ncbi:MAG: hypothetical protein ACREDR_30630, partial [Blastocatellia bacterium]